MRIFFASMLSFILFLSGTATAQIEFSALDTSMWEVDTISNSLVPKPKFQFTNDTLIYFFQTINERRTNVCSVLYKQGAKYYTGIFNGNSQFPNRNNFIQLNLQSEELDSVAFSNLIDTIVITPNGRNYCIFMKRLGIGDPLLREEIISYTSNYGNSPDLFCIADDTGNTELPIDCLHSMVFIYETEPPYGSMEWISKAVIRK
ncbi:MAG: hypothetical protein ABI772_14405 [Bacteroidota bacterium]